MHQKEQFIPSQPDYCSRGLILIRQMFNETLSFVHQPQNILPGLPIKNMIYQNNNSKNNLIYKLNISFLCDWTLKQIQIFNTRNHSQVNLNHDDKYCLKLIFKLFSFLNLFYLNISDCSTDFNQYLSRQLDEKVKQLHLLNNRNNIQSPLIKYEELTLVKFNILLEANTYFSRNNWRQQFQKDQLFDCCKYVITKLVKYYYQKIIKLNNNQGISLLMSYLIQANCTKIQKIGLQLYNYQMAKERLYTYIYLLYDVEGLDKLSIYLRDASKNQLIHEIKYLKNLG